MRKRTGKLMLIFLIGLIAGLGCARSSAQVKKVDLGPWPAGKSPQEVGKRVAEEFVARRGAQAPSARGGTSYPIACTWYGTLTFAKLTNDTDLRDRAIKVFDPFVEKKQNMPAPKHVDASVFGIVPLEMYMQNQDKRYLDLGLKSADAQWTTPANTANLSPEAKEAIGMGLSWQTRFWIDDMYMLISLQTQAYRATQDKKYLDHAAAEMAAYLDRLQQPNGLFYHAPDVPFFWGRGDGWVAAGMSELLRELPADHPKRARIMEGYKKMMAALLKNQDKDGMWHQLIDHPEAWPESSCTGMFTFAMITGVKNGWLEGEDYKNAACKGWLGVVSYLGEDSKVREVCIGTNKKNDLQYYLDRPRSVGDFHGQAPILWCASALLR